jgi:imidazolonepropionase-like amidohydrolase
VDLIKVMASGGTLTPGTRQDSVQFSPDELRRLVEAAHALGLPVTAHAHATASIRAALDAGVDGLEHVTFWSATGIDAPDELLDTLAKSGVFVGATLGFDPPGDYDELPEPLARRLPTIDANIARLHARGARVLVGTDAGVAKTKHHSVLPFGISHLASLGVSHGDALSSATSRAAEACGLPGSKGSLRAGFDADILVVQGDPLTDLAALHDVRAVYRAGARVR